MEDNQKQIKDYLQQSEAQMSDELNRKIASSEFLLAKEKKETMQQIEDIAETLAKAQTALDLVNSTVEFEIDI